ncbi:MAG: 3-phosphoshikimate 1-carboxyvinyltransferase [Pirellulales bacterium]|nr:3-phosphoshikimate 1-carboxyvinyltransferase [Pirellulales bacterium]
MQPGGTVAGTIRPPGSKSITNRALICAALAKGSSLLTGALESDDTHVMLDSLARLGISVNANRQAHTISVAGCGGRIPAREAELFIGNSGTSVRFLSAMLALGEGRYRLDGTPRMRERPIQDLADTLNALGARVTCESPGGCPPLAIEASGLQGGIGSVRGDTSSQFTSGLLMAGPYMREGLDLSITGAIVSLPYITMTAAVMSSFGVDVVDLEASRYVVPTGRYQGRTYDIEPDASAASYFFGAAAITGGEIAVQGLSRHSLQGDVAFVDVLEKMGCQVEFGPSHIKLRGGKLRGIDVDMNPISDTVQTLAAVALFADGPTTITGVGHIRHKETDRIGAMAAELRKLGAKVDEFDEGLKITPATLHGAELATYDDHRMAMSLALVGLRQAGVRILDPGCTAKTYPDFFHDLARVRRNA